MMIRASEPPIRVRLYRESAIVLFSGVIGSLLIGASRDFINAQTRWYSEHIGNGYNVNRHLDRVTMKAVQLRMARAAVGWGVRELAKQAGVTANTVTRIENGADAKQSTIDALRQALEAAGVEFTNGDRPGVRLSNSAKDSRPPVPAKAAGAKTEKQRKKQ
jgi:transcriptional regulator with XRE-family HTH domain